MKTNDSILKLLSQAVAAENAHSRRHFLKKSTQLAFLSSAAWLNTPALNLFEPTKSKYKIAVVGAGIAGLTAAHTLKQRGIEAKVFEASGRAGGRIFTKQGLFDGLTTEWGAEMIDSAHDDMFRLIRLLGLQDRVIDFEKDPLIRETVFADGLMRSEKDILEALKPVAHRILTDQKTIDVLKNTEGVKRFDNMSISAYLESLDLPKWLFNLLEQTFTNLNGVESGNQSALNFLSVIHFEQKKVKVLGDSDERFKILGGNSAITDGLAALLKNQIAFKHKLLAVKSKANGNVELVFENENRIVEETFDAVVLATPFSILRELELDFEMSPQKRNTILGQLYGTNTKFFMAFSERTWRKDGRQGYFLSDKCAGWDSSQGQNKNQGLGTLMCFLGGDAGKNALPETAEKSISQYLPQINNIFPDSTTLFTNKTHTANWSTNPLVKGSYSTFGVGQVLDMKDVGQQPCGNIFFAGEHCSFEFIGYMNGGAKTGREAAEKILKKVKK